MQKSNTIISPQIESIKESLSLYNVSLENDSYEKLTILVKGIVSVKIFFDCSSEEDNYIKEIISNLNQFSILSFLGFRVASMVLLRRCLENVLSSIYYKEHKIEYIKKELDSDKRNFNKIDDLLNYFIEYPYTHFYKNVEINYITSLITQVKSKWDESYKKLSKYVHSSSTSYLDLHNFLDKIKYDNDKMQECIVLYKDVITIINTIFIIFFKEKYDFLEDEKKIIIRDSIYNDDIKRKIIEVFKNI